MKLFLETIKEEKLHKLRTVLGILDSVNFRWCGAINWESDDLFDLEAVLLGLVSPVDQKIKKRWDLLTRAKNLRTLALINQEISEVPSNIGELRHLRYLDLSGNKMETLPDSICKLYQLQSLKIHDCKLKELPREVTSLVNLRRINIRGCIDTRWLPKFAKLPNLRDLQLKLLSTINDNTVDVIDTTPIEYFPALRRLHIENFSGMKTLLPSPSSTVAFPCLETLQIINCPTVESIGTSPSLRSESALSSFKSLRNIWLKDVGGTQPLDIINYHNSGNLTSLSVESMNEMTSLPQELSSCTKLESLRLIECQKLTSLPAGLKSLVSLKTVEIDDCVSLSRIPNGTFCGLSSLCELSICGSHFLLSLPDDMFQGLFSLRVLNIRCFMLTRIPTGLEQCTSLEVLNIFSRDWKIPILELIPHLPHLRELETDMFEINEYDNRRFLSDDTDVIVTTSSQESLVRLALHGGLENAVNAKSLPQQLFRLHLPCLQILEIYGFTTLLELFEWIGTLSSLQQLTLRSCLSLKYLPSKDHLTQLQRLLIFNCPLLRDRIRAKDDDGVESEWPKISHIPYIEIDYMQFSRP